jgi:hypothetical protein
MSHVKAAIPMEGACRHACIWSEWQACNSFDCLSALHLEQRYDTGRGQLSSCRAVITAYPGRQLDQSLPQPSLLQRACVEESAKESRLKTGTRMVVPYHQGIAQTRGMHPGIEHPAAM